MADLTPQAIVESLQASRFTHAGPDASSLTDPIVDTPMLVTLDELHSYDLNPRITRNPKYDDIKASIAARGLDAPPPITRRPNETQFIIRNGGNTRLSILRELWSETKNERFYRILCLFRPWSARGEIVSLTGHLAENELQGSLTFIERALGIEKARELYEHESGTSLSQRELARRLCADGYPVTQSHISRMQDAVLHLLPAIPSVLYAGLGKPQIERLTALRRAAHRSWDRHASDKELPTDFHALFREVLTTFDSEPDAFNVQRVQDELLGQLSELLAVDYDTLALELVDAEARQNALSTEPAPHDGTNPPPPASTAQTSVPHRVTQSPPAAQAQEQAQAPAPARSSPPIPEPPASPPPSAPSPLTPPGADHTSPQERERLQGHIVSPAETTERLQSIQRLIAAATGETLENFEANAVRAIPVQAGGLHPISDVWYIEPAIDSPERLRTHIAQLALEIAEEAGVADRVETVDEGVGFVCFGRARAGEPPPPALQRGVLTLLNSLSIEYVSSTRNSIDGIRLSDDLGPLLLGPSRMRRAAPQTCRTSDSALVKLFRLIRLARRLLELESSYSSPPTGSSSR